MNRDLEVLEQIFLFDHENQATMVISSDIKQEKGYNAFTVSNFRDGVTYKITFKMEEI